MKRAKYIFFSICLTGFMIAIIANSQLAKQGATNGIELSLKIVIPSLLPMLIITNSIVKSKCADVFDLIFGGITKHILNLPRQVTACVIFGLLGGYPAGAILTKTLLQKGYIDDGVARRILRFNFSGGIAFIITAIGTIKYNNTRLGVLLYLVITLSAIIIAFFEGLFYKRENEQTHIARLDISDAVIEAVEDGTKSILIMTSYIVLFSVISKIFELPYYIAPLLEITNGIFDKRLDASFSLLAFYLSFGGICVHFQIFDVIKQAKMNYFDFLLHRIIGAMLTYFLGKIAMVLFPQDISVFSNTTIKTVNLGQQNNLLSVVLLVGCVVLICDIKNRKSELI